MKKVYPAAQQAVESGQVLEWHGGGPGGEALEAARHELRHALRKAGPYTAEEARRVAEILHRAAAEIRSVFAEVESEPL